MHDPLQVFAFLVAQDEVREQFGPAPGRPRPKPEETKRRLTARVKTRVAAWLRKLANHLEPVDAGTASRIHA